MKDVNLDREYSFKSQRLQAGTSPSIPFAENLFRKFQWNCDSIILNAPEGSGVYGLFSALWIYIGEAENILSLQPIGAVASKSSSRHCNRCAMVCNGKVLALRTDR